MVVAEGFSEINWKEFGRKRSFSNGGNCDNPGISMPRVTDDRYKF
jgi:hypothetical protein